MVSYLSNQNKDSEDSRFRTIGYAIIFITIINLIITYTFIQLYLKFKHSKAIDIAEKMNLHKHKSMVSFKRLMIGFFVLSIAGLLNFGVYETNFYKNKKTIPPGFLGLNFLTVFFSLCFILKKKRVMEFIGRRWAVVVDQFTFKSSFGNQRNKIHPQN